MSTKNQGAADIFLRAALDARMAGQAAREAERQERIDSRRSVLARTPVEIVQAFNIDLANARFDDESGRLGVEGQIEVDGRWYGVLLSVDGSGWPELRFLEIDRTLPVYDSPGVEERIGEALLRAISYRRAAVRQAVKSEIGNILGGASNQDIWRAKNLIDGVDDEDREQLRRLLAWQVRTYVMPARRQQRANLAALRRTTAAAAELRRLAQEFAGLRRVWLGLAEEWAAIWTARLWEPSVLWSVRYAPVSWLASLDDDAWIQSVVTWTPPHDLTGLGSVLMSVAFSGVVGTLVIGAFLDATPIEPVVADIKQRLPYHRWYGTGGFTVNVPAHVSAEPTPFAVAEPQWVEFVGERRPELVEYAERYGQHRLVSVESTGGDQ